MVEIPRDLINGVPRDQYGMWCEHGKHVLIADPEDTSDHPAQIPADPWPCGSCTYSQLMADLKAEAEEYEADRLAEYNAIIAEGISFGRMQ